MERASKSELRDPEPDRATDPPDTAIGPFATVGALSVVRARLILRCRCCHILRRLRADIMRPNTMTPRERMMSRIDNCGYRNDRTAHVRRLMTENCRQRSDDRDIDKNVRRENRRKIIETAAKMNRQISPKHRSCSPVAGCQTKSGRSRPE